MWLKAKYKKKSNEIESENWKEIFLKMRDKNSLQEILLKIKDYE